MNLPGEPGRVRATISRQGNVPISGVSVEVEALLPTLTFTGSTESFIGPVASRETVIREFEYITDPATPLGEMLRTGGSIVQDEGSASGTTEERFGVFGRFIDVESTLVSGEIPDNTPSGISREFVYPQRGLIRDCKLTISITHPRRGDLIVRLRNVTEDLVATVPIPPPSNAADLGGTFDLEYFGEIQGRHILEIIDTAPGNVGRLNSASLSLEYQGYGGEPWPTQNIVRDILGLPTAGEPADTNEDGVIDARDVVNSLRVHE